MKSMIRLISFIAIILIFYWFSNNGLKISTFTLKSNKIPSEFNDMKILQLTDLHSKSFGTNNKRLISKINKINPDIIVVTGDMLNASNDDGTVFLELCQNLTQKYTIYYTYGNHEEILEMRLNRLNDNWLNEYIKKLENLGVIILNNSKIELIKKEQHINLYGLVLPMSYYNKEYRNNPNVAVQLTPEDLQNSYFQLKKDKFNIVLAHTPFYFEEYSTWGADLVLAGHVHGGIVNIPFVGGLLSPDVEFFPKYYGGKYEIDDSTMIVGRGLGNSSINLRIFNRPELVVIKLKNDSK
ncbi:metallophosphoesterase [Clostridium grantii]|uniref:Calcineurin-like phosphoesterase domain-containing protein n=1 Tax=Clostridium grantii DSM 8605 TaxID=1121316 RepID=A0A1M5X637_9CLOT|nr:metallophosphoesterase [Clostridium grantii]SHH95271.1 hypothetical protein SAMN02745207_03378 [Clostridium grantii DSM 8605]